MTVDEVRDIRDMAEAARYYARERDLGLEAINHAAEIKLRAERKLGGMLAEMPKQHGARPSDSESHDVIPPSLTDLGIEPMQSHRWQQVAKVPEPVFEQPTHTRALR